jgi:hypothetical protein
MNTCLSFARIPRTVALAFTLGLALASASHAQGTYIYQDGYASTGGCNAVRDDPPYLFLQDAGPVMRERHRATAMAQDLSGNVSRYSGSLKLGKIYPFHASAHVADTTDCTQQLAQAVTDFTFVDKIEVTAGSHPVGTPVTYTATVNLPVSLMGRGQRCGINSEFVATLYLNDQKGEWRSNGPFQGVGQLVVTATALAGQQMQIGLDTRAVASALRYRVSDTFCASNEVALTEPVRIVLTADTLGANTTSINGVHYGDRP